MKKALSIKRIIKSFGYALNGIKHAIKEEPNMKIHITMAILVIIAGFVFKVSTLEWIVLLFAIGLVIAAELYNTAIENLVDYVSMKQSNEAMHIKDTSASFVFLLAIISAIIGLIIFVPKFLALIGVM